LFQVDFKMALSFGESRDFLLAIRLPGLLLGLIGLLPLGRCGAGH
jgi:hypothetical protein